MSRICGNAVWTGTPGPDDLLQRMVSTLTHSERYAVDTRNLPGLDVATIALPGSFQATFVATGEDRACVFAGYLVGHAGDPAAHLLAIANDDAALAGLNGVFNAAVWDGRARELHLISDRYGMRPLYYEESAGGVRFASEIKALASTSGGLEPDEEAFEEFVAFECLIGEKTLYRNIRALPPASRLTFGPHGPRVQRYWWFDRIEVQAGTTPDDYAAATTEALRAALQDLGRMVERPICCLSAGFDSRRLVLELARSGRRVDAYTAATVSGGGYVMDIAVARELCGRLGFSHTAAPLITPARMAAAHDVVGALLDDHSDEHEWMAPLLQHIPLGVGTNFDGLAGDRLLGDFFFELPYVRLMQLGSNEAIARHLATEPMRAHIAGRIRRRIERPLEDRIRTALDDLPDNPNKVALFYLMSRARRKVALLTNGVVSTKVESIFPYLDNRVVECVLSHDPEVRVGRDYQARALAADFPTMADIPHSHFVRPPLLKEYYMPVAGWNEEYQRRLIVRSSRAALMRPGILRWFSWRVRVTAAVQAAVGFVPWLSRRILGAGWVLKHLTHLIWWHKSLSDPAAAQARLDRARRYIMSEPQGVAPGGSIESRQDSANDRAS